jgi:hypothetical protein
MIAITDLHATRISLGIPVDDGALLMLRNRGDKDIPYDGPGSPLRAGERRVFKSKRGEWRRCRVREVLGVFGF